MNRVVITGIGAVTPLGNDVDTTWEAMKNGVCGIDVITRFDPSTTKAKVAGEVKNFDPTAYIDKREVTEQRAEYVEVIIENDKSAKEILLKKNGFRWQIDREEDYSDAPDNVYFAKFRKETWDINDKKRMEQWTACTLTVPDKDGNLYQLETKEDGSKCYTSTTCVGLYKTKKGRVYEFFYNWDYQNDKPGKCSWVPSKNKYEYYKENNKYKAINEKEARRIIRTYCPDYDFK